MQPTGQNGCKGDTVAWSWAEAEVKKTAATMANTDETAKSGEEKLRFPPLDISRRRASFKSNGEDETWPGQQASFWPSPVIILFK